MRTRGSGFDAATRLLLAMAGLKLLIHLATNTFAGYGIFRDELYYLASTYRPDLGYVDHPPLSVYILGVNRLLFGTSLFAVRLLPAVFGALTVLFAGLTVRRLGGGIWAILVAALAVIMAPILLAMNTVYSMNSLDVLLWSISLYTLILIVQDNRPQHWLLLGSLVGMGMLNKTSTVWFAAALVVALLLTAQRSHLKTKWPYLSGLIAFVLALPYLAWNLLHDFPHLEFIRNATQYKYADVTPVHFIAGQFTLMQPVSVLVWLSGLYFLFAARGRTDLRAVGALVVIVFGILVLNGHSKPEYLAVTYPVVFAAGAVQLERLAASRYMVWFRFVLPAAILIVGCAIAPFTLPILPVETFIRYTHTTGMSPQSHEGHELTRLHQFYADMFGWENMARTVSGIYGSLPPEEQQHTIVYARNYGEAGAIEYFRDKYELPPVLCPHNSYWFWGQEHAGMGYRTLILIGGEGIDPVGFADSVEQQGVIQSRYAIPYENNLPVYVCRDLRQSVEALRAGYHIFI